MLLAMKGCRFRDITIRKYPSARKHYIDSDPFRGCLPAEQASELERCGPFEFAAAANVALSKGQPAASPLAPLLEIFRSTVGRALGPVLEPALDSVLAGSGGPAFRQPPIVETAVGPPAKSFPLHLVHAGR